MSAPRDKAARFPVSNPINPRRGHVIRKLVLVAFAALMAVATPAAGVPPIPADVDLIAPIRYPATGDTSGGTNRGCWEYSSADRGLARRTNRARSRRGIRRMKLDPQLSKVASRHSARMARKDLLYHSTDLGHVVTRWSVLGENVGVGGSIASLHRAFMRSPAHRDNIVHGEWRYFGTGTKRRNGRLWVTVVFEAERDPGTRLTMPPC